MRSGISSGEINLFGAGLVEAEVGLVLAHDLPPKPDLSKYTPEEAWEAVDSVVAVIELCGRRSSRSCSAIPRLALFSDALMSGGVRVGRVRSRLDFTPAQLASLATSLEVLSPDTSEGGQRVWRRRSISRGNSSTCANGGPVQALAWAANSLNERGLSLRKGHLVITGATAIATNFSISDRVIASLGELGSVETQIVP